LGPESNYRQNQDSRATTSEITMPEENNPNTAPEVGTDEQQAYVQDLVDTGFSVPLGDIQTQLPEQLLGFLEDNGIISPHNASVPDWENTYGHLPHISEADAKERFLSADPDRVPPGGIFGRMGAGHDPLTSQSLASQWRADKRRQDLLTELDRLNGIAASNRQTFLDNVENAGQRSRRDLEQQFRAAKGGSLASLASRGLLNSSRFGGLIPQLLNSRSDALSNIEEQVGFARNQAPSTLPQANILAQAIGSPPTIDDTTFAQLQNQLAMFNAQLDFQKSQSGFDFGSLAGTLGGAFLGGGAFGAGGMFGQAVPAPTG